MKNILYHRMPVPTDPLSEKFPTRGQCDCDCDCACAAVSTGISCDKPSSTLWRKADDLCSLALSPEYTLFLSAKNNGFALLAASARSLLDQIVSPTALDGNLTGQTFQNAMRHFVAAGLLSPVENDCACSTDQGSCGTPKEGQPPLVAWLHVTDRCNLRCAYCYLPHAREDMSLEIGVAAVEASFRSAVANGFKEVKLKYAGGEPLLNYPLILELHQRAMALAGKHDLGLEEVVLSNGTLLTAQIAEVLRTMKMRLMISLDGYGSYHDSHRPYAGGRGSFKDVAEAVELAIASGLTPTISVTVSSRTANGLSKIMSWILERNLPFSLNFYRENELSASYKDMKLDEEKIIAGMLDACRAIENNIPRQPFLGGLIDRANLTSAHTHTCAVGRNYLVFDQHGQVAKCQMQMPKTVTHVHVADPLAFIRADQTGIQNISVDEKQGCKTCEWRYWCTGGCPLSTFRATGHYDLKSPNCNIYKALYPEALRLEGLRLLKYQDDPEVVMHD